MLKPFVELNTSTDNVLVVTANTDFLEANNFYKDDIYLRHDDFKQFVLEQYESYIPSISSLIESGCLMELIVFEKGYRSILYLPHNYTNAPYEYEGNYYQSISDNYTYILADNSKSVSYCDCVCCKKARDAYRKFGDLPTNTNIDEDEGHLVDGDLETVDDTLTSIYSIIAECSGENWEASLRNRPDTSHRLESDGFGVFVEQTNDTGYGLDTFFESTDSMMLDNGNTLDVQRERVYRTKEFETLLSVLKRINGVTSPDITVFLMDNIYYLVVVPPVDLEESRMMETVYGVLSEYCLGVSNRTSVFLQEYGKEIISDGGVQEFLKYF